MKNIYTAIFFIALAGLFTSCQKSYTPEGVVIGSGTGAGGGNTQTGNGTLLTKMTVTETGFSTVYTYTYDANNRLITIDEVAVTTIGVAQTIKFNQHFVRDATGKITQYIMKNNIPDFPVDGATYTMHYPPGSAFFDYMTGSYVFAGTQTRDSILFAINSGRVSKYTSYGNYDNTGYMMNDYAVFVYDISGNMTNESDYDNSSALTSSYDYQYDSKVNPLQLGQESVFAIQGAARSYSINNEAKSVITDYTIGVQKSTAVFTYQYNSANKPISAVAVDPANSANNVQITYTY